MNFYSTIQALHITFQQIRSQIEEIITDSKTKETSKINELEFQRKKITTCLEQAIPNSPDHLVEETKKLQNKWIKFCSKVFDNPETPENAAQKYQRLWNLIDAIYKKTLAPSPSSNPISESKLLIEQSIIYGTTEEEVEDAMQILQDAFSESHSDWPTEKVDKKMKKTKKLYSDLLANWTPPT